MGLESSGARAEQMARQLICHGRLMDKNELIAKVDAVEGEDVRQLLETMILGEPTVAVVGAGARSQDHAQRASRSFRAAAA